MKRSSISYLVFATIGFSLLAGCLLTICFQIATSVAKGHAFMGHNVYDLEIGTYGALATMVIALPFLTFAAFRGITQFLRWWFAERRRRRPSS